MSHQQTYTYTNLFNLNMLDKNALIEMLFVISVGIHFAENDCNLIHSLFLIIFYFLHRWKYIWKQPKTKWKHTQNTFLSFRVDS